MNRLETKQYLQTIFVLLMTDICPFGFEKTPDRVAIEALLRSN